MIRSLFVILIALAAAPLYSLAAEPATHAYREGATKSEFHGYTRYDFTSQGRKAYIIEPDRPLPGNPWIWRARFDSKAFPAFDKAMLAEGYHVAKVDVAGLFGGPMALKIFDAFYLELTAKYGFSTKPTLEGLSRGGLPIFNWAAVNPVKVSCVYADAAVCDIRSWPGGKGKGKGAPPQWKSCLESHGITEKQSETWKGSPVDKAHLLARAGVPVVFVAGDADDVVPADENALVMEKRYNAALSPGGLPMKVILKPGIGHHPHGLEDPSEVVAFVKKATNDRSSAGANAGPASLPNMVFVLTDDQGWGDVAYNGHPKIKTPHLDAMAKAGLRFDRFYAAASVCSPTRATCLNGRNNWRVAMNNPMRPDEGHLPASEITIAEALKEKGYATGHFGKWHVGGFDPVRAGGHLMPPWEAGFDECFSTRNVVVTHDPYAKPHKEGVTALYWHNGRNIPFEEGQNDPSLRGDDAAIVMNKALAFIRTQAEAKKPFLALVWFHNVHTPLGKNKELMEQYSDCDPQEQVYYSNITAVDTQVGALRKTLRDLGVEENTMLWFASDNGPNLKGKKDVRRADAQGGKFTYTPIGSAGAFRGWKRDCYEGGLRVPGILEWPAKIKEPFATDFPAVTSDYFPTAFAAAGIPLPSDRAYDGVNLLPVIEGRMNDRPAPIGFHCNGMQAWTGNRYKIVRTVKAKKNPDPSWELYDLLEDPFEESNLATSKPEVLEDMIAGFNTWAASASADEENVIGK